MVLQCVELDLASQSLPKCRGPDSLGVLGDEGSGLLLEPWPLRIVRASVDSTNVGFRAGVFSLTPPPPVRGEVFLNH